jgi:hypothetical protein
VLLAKVTMNCTNGPAGGALVVVGAAVVVWALVVVAAVVVAGPLVAGGAVVVAGPLVDGAAVVVAEPLVVGASVVVAEPLVVGAVVVVAGPLVGGAVSVDVAPEVATVDVGASDVVLEPLDAVDVAPLVSVEAEELSPVEVEKVVPIVIGETSPSAPETSSPSANSVATPTTNRIRRRRILRRVTRFADPKLPQLGAASQSPVRRNTCRVLPWHILGGFRSAYYWPMGLFDLALREVELSPPHAVFAGAERLGGAVEDVGAEASLERHDTPPDQDGGALEAPAGMQRLVLREDERLRRRAESSHACRAGRERSLVLPQQPPYTRVAGLDPAHVRRPREDD